MDAQDVAARAVEPGEDDDAVADHDSVKRGQEAGFEYERGFRRSFIAC